ncbi:MAG: hypothetical protein FJY97_17155 [candidate division Zixibacteria bacterium]|nr:hypothetical protein [candidate division Zixibacteria bacterium]
MDDTSLLQEMERLAERLAIRVRYAKLDGDGGLCRYRGVYHLVVNRKLDTKSRIAVIGRALAQCPLDQVFLVPAVRETLDRVSETSENP